MNDNFILNKDNILEKKHIVQTYDTNYFREVKISDMIKYFQEMASKSSALMKIGFDELLEHNYTWVLLKQRIKIFRLPKDQEIFIVCTWCKKLSKLFAEREFLVKTEDDETLVKVTSEWGILDLSKRRLGSFNNVDTQFCYYNSLDMFEQKIQKIRFLNEKEVHHYFHKVMFTEIDINHHMNNTCYVDLIINGVIDYIGRPLRMTELICHYGKEARFKEDLKVITYEITENNFKHLIVNADNKELFKAITFWE